MGAERLQKILAHAGVASRRAAEQLLVEGRVTVNGKVVKELGARADPARDRVEVDGRRVQAEELVYYLLHKPRAMVTTLSDPEGRPTIAELLAVIPERVYPVGRLDFHTSGALLITNDGQLAEALLHPRRGVRKTYVAKLDGIAEPKQIEALRKGVTLDDGYQTRAASVSVLRSEEGHSWLEISIAEGKNRQIHRMAEAVGLRVMRLSRTRFAGLDTQGLRPEQMRQLGPEEVAELRRTYLNVIGDELIPSEREKRGERSREPESKERPRSGDKREARSREPLGKGRLRTADKPQPAATKARLRTADEREAPAGKARFGKREEREAPAGKARFGTGAKREAPAGKARFGRANQRDAEGGERRERSERASDKHEQKPARAAREAPRAARAEAQKRAKPVGKAKRRH